MTGKFELNFDAKLKFELLNLAFRHLFFKLDVKIYRKFDSCSVLKSTRQIQA